MSPAAVGVVIPARDEQDTVADCVRSVQRAAARVTVPCQVLVVADSCSDATAGRAAAAGAAVLSVQYANVGRARAAGAAAFLRSVAADAWLACTDADSTVPVDWLAHQLAAAWHGWHAVAGHVRVADAAWLRDFRTWYSSVGGHVHGANLGVHAAAYRRAGGFPPLASGEDTALVAALLATGAAVLNSAATPVHTSARSRGRAPEGFAERIRAFTGDLV